MDIMRLILLLLVLLLVEFLTLILLKVLEVMVYEARGLPWFEVDPFVACHLIESGINVILYISLSLSLY